MNKWNYNLQVFTQENAISYYLLGAFMTDGCINTTINNRGDKHKHSVTLTSKDKDWLETINQLICPLKPLIKHGKNCYRLMYNSTELGKWLIAQGCYGRKSLTLQFPIIPTMYFSDFIRGCWDGDGSLSFTKSGNGGKHYQRQANLTSGSKSFCESMVEILSIHNIKCSVKTHNQSDRMIENRKLQASNCYRVVLSGGEGVYNLVKWIYNGSLSMPRKQTIADNIVADWEQVFRCEDCHIILSPDKHGRKRKRCDKCCRLNINAKRREKYNLKRS